MISGGGISFLFSKLISLGPIFLVYLAAIVLALRNMERARLPSLLTVVGVAVSIGTTLMTITVHTLIINNRDSGIGMANQLMIVNIMGNVFNAVGYGFFVAAIFVGRDHVPPEDRYLHE